MSRQLITFQLSDQVLGIDIMAIREIRAWSPATPLPNVPEYVRGVVNLRGVVLPVLDLRHRLNWGTTDTTARHVIIVVQISVGHTANVVRSKRCPARDVETASSVSPIDVRAGQAIALIAFVVEKDHIRLPIVIDIANRVADRTQCGQLREIRKAKRSLIVPIDIGQQFMEIEGSRIAKNQFGPPVPVQISGTDGAGSDGGKRQPRARVKVGAVRIVDVRIDPRGAVLANQV